jgi:MinD-like ATPase involved in chromosome partitioning or flagellar assembly
MARIISVHSYRGGTGKSNITANLAVNIARRGHRVGIVDTDVQSPGIHVLFGFDAARAERCLNDYLWGECAIQDTAHDVSVPPRAEDGQASIDRTSKDGTLYLIPASIKPSDIARILREGYDVELLSDGLDELIVQLELDYLFVDTHPGLHEETLSYIASSDVLLLILRPDHQDYQGTAVIVDVARKLEVPELQLVLNMVLPRLDSVAIREQMAQTYGAPVAGVLPATEELMALASSGVFSLHHPDHPWSRALLGIAEQLEG